MRSPKTSSITPASLQMWRERMGWLQKQAARELGVSERQYQRYEEGTSPVPLPLWSRCKLLYLGTEDFRMRQQSHTRENLLAWLKDFAMKDMPII